MYLKGDPKYVLSICNRIMRTKTGWGGYWTPVDLDEDKKNEILEHMALPAGNRLRWLGVAVRTYEQGEISLEDGSIKGIAKVDGDGNEVFEDYIWIGAAGIGSEAGEGL